MPKYLIWDNANVVWYSNFLAKVLDKAMELSIKHPDRIFKIMTSHWKGIAQFKNGFKVYK